MIKPKPCPFCSHPGPSVHTRGIFPPAVFHVVICQHCDARGPAVLEDVHDGTQDDVDRVIKTATAKAIIRWNDRVIT